MRNIRQHKTYSELLCYTKKNSCVTAHLTLRKGLLNMKNIMILDGHSLAFRAYHALPVLNAPDGTPTNVIAGFMNMLSRLENDVRPDCIAAVFDAPGPTFRHELYLDYKAQRKPTPEDFKPQIPILQELLGSMGYPVLSLPGVEADDVIASLALSAADGGRESMIVSMDKDLMQVLGERIKIIRPLKGITSLTQYDTAAFEKDYGFLPPSFADYLALMGDSSDNIPGVPGIGEKSAKQLIGDWGSIANIYSSLEEIKPAWRKKLEAGRESAFLSLDLTRIKCDVPLDLNICLSASIQIEKALELCNRLSLSKVAAQVRSMEKKAGLPPAIFTIGAAAEAKKIRAEPDFNCELSSLENSDEIILHPYNLNCESFLIADFNDRCVSCGRKELAEFLAGRKGHIIVEDYKSMTSALGSDFFKGLRIWDLKTANYLLHPDAPYKGSSNISPHSLAALAPDETPLPALGRLYEKLASELAAYEGLNDLMEKIELPLIPVLTDMERHGVRLAPAVFDVLQKELEGRLTDIEADIEARAGESINLNSPKQVADLLFERLGLPVSGKTKGKTSLSTSASVLEGLASLDVPHSDVPRLLLEHRELSKMLSGFTIPLQKAAIDGIIHTTFEAALTGTGRLSSRNPNLQNLPAFGNWAVRIKEGLVPVRDGNVFVAADYSQVELRILAHLSGEERLIEAFADKRDIHKETASWVFSVEPERVTPELRRVAKMINFGLLYGMSAFGLAERLGIDRGEASRIVKRYFAALPGVEKYLKESASEAHARGYTMTVFGRIRPLSEASEGVRDKSGLNRVVINTPIQGTAADIARKAMVEFHGRFSGDPEVRLFLQIHDSLVCECPAGRAEEVGEALSFIMKNAASLSVPLETELKTGISLAEV